VRRASFGHLLWQVAVGAHSLTACQPASLAGCVAARITTGLRAGTPVGLISLNPRGAGVTVPVRGPACAHPGYETTH
jgi:hypothetical protein